jgi:hypothetical protein
MGVVANRFCLAEQCFYQILRFEVGMPYTASPFPLAHK